MNINMKEGGRVYIESRMLSDFGYFRLGDNHHNLKTFKDIEDDSLFESSKVVGLIKDKLNYEPDRIPILLDLPPRPKDSINIEEVDLSLAEIAGSLSAIKTFKGKESVVMGITHLGSYSERWFNRLIIEGSTINEDKQRWMLQARGEEKVLKLDEHPSIAYLRSEELMDKYLVQSQGDTNMYSLKFGNLIMSFSKDTSVKLDTQGEIVNRKDLHALIGFSKYYYLYATSRDSATPRMRLINKPFTPYSEMDGDKSIEELVSVDRIKSYV
jgi:hypothetical protein